MLATDPKRPALGPRPGQLPTDRRQGRSGGDRRGLLRRGEQDPPTLTFDGLNADHYTLKVLPAVESADGLPLGLAYTTDFQAVSDFSPFLGIHFSAGRANKVQGTVTYDVSVTNLTAYNLVTPLILYVDGLQPPGASLVGGVVDAATGQSWLGPERGDQWPGAPPRRLDTGDHVHHRQPIRAKLAFKSGVYTRFLDNAAPIFDSTPPASATVGLALPIPGGGPRPQRRPGQLRPGRRPRGHGGRPRHGCPHLDADGEQPAPRGRDPAGLQRARRAQLAAVHPRRRRGQPAAGLRRARPPVRGRRGPADPGRRQRDRPRALRARLLGRQPPPGGVVRPLDGKRVDKVLATALAVDPLGTHA